MWEIIKENLEGHSREFYVRVTFVLPGVPNSYRIGVKLS